MQRLYSYFESENLKGIGQPKLEIGQAALDTRTGTGTGNDWHCIKQEDVIVRHLCVHIPKNLTAVFYTNFTVCVN